MAYENLGEGALDYYPCRYGKSKLLFRGPRRNLEDNYVAFLGGTETYGKFLERPFPALVEEEIGTVCVNFGYVNAGVDVFANEPEVLGACSRARATVIQVMGAQNMSNRFYAVHPRRNDRFVCASRLMKTIFRDVDFTDFSFTRHMLHELQALSQERFAIVRDELKEAWVGRMRRLLARIEGKTVLLWFAAHSPDEADSFGALGRDPLFIDREMIEEVRSHATHVVEVVVRAPEADRPGDGLVYSPLEEPATRGMLGATAHAAVAARLAEVLPEVI